MIDQDTRRRKPTQLAVARALLRHPQLLLLDIVVLDAGRVRAVGTHAELLGADPLYAELAATQFLVPAD